jgi:hypothetical protein
MHTRPRPGPRQVAARAESPPRGLSPGGASQERRGEKVNHVPDRPALSHDPVLRVDVDHLGPDGSGFLLGDQAVGQHDD